MAEILRSVRNKTRLAGGMLVLLLVAGCGSDPEPNVPAPNIATVAGAGENITIDDDIERGDYPDACKLLPDSSVATLLEAPATSGRTINGCSWTTGLASFPSIGITWIRLGSGAKDIYDQGADDVDAKVNLPIGESARRYLLQNEGDDNKTVRVDVYQPRAFFEVDVDIVTTSAPELARANRIATRVAQLVADQVD